MSRVKSREADRRRRELSLEDLPQGTVLHAPELDLRDDDVIGLDAMRSGFFPPPTDEEAAEEAAYGEQPDDYGPEDLVSAAAEPAEEAAAESAAAETVLRPVQPLTRPGWRWTERLLIGLLAANSLVVGLLMFAPSVFRAPPATTTMRGQPPAAPARDGRPLQSVGATRGGVVEARPAAMPDPAVYETAQHWIGRGYYERATRILDDYLAAHADLTPLQAQAVHSSLAYCALRLGDQSAAELHATTVESLRRLTATPDVLWQEAKQAGSAGRPTAMRALYSRLLLKQDSLAGWRAARGSGEDRLDAARAGLGDSYREAAERPEQGGRVIR